MKSALTTALLSCVVFFGLGEFGSRLWIEKHGNALDVTRKVLQADQALGWRQRPDLNTSFLNLPLVTNEWGWRGAPVASYESSKNKILILGPSSSFGWGVKSEESYPAQLETMLRSNVDATVINAGEIGYSTHQGLRLFLLPRVQELRPKIVVIAYGVNDLDRHRFYFQSEQTDAEELTKQRSELPVRLLSTITSSSLASVSLKFAGWLQRYINPAAQHRLLVNASALPLRVPADDFRKNLKQLAQAARASGAEVVFLTTVTNLLPGSPATQTAGQAKARIFFEQAKSAWDQGRIAAAQELLDRSVALDPAASEPYYYRCALAAKSAQWTEAQAWFERGNNNEPARVKRDVEAYNAILRSVAREEKVLVGELDRWLKNINRDELFVDPIHFSARGNSLIARGLSAVISGLLRQERRR